MYICVYMSVSTIGKSREPLVKNRPSNASQCRRRSGFSRCRQCRALPQRAGDTSKKREIATGVSLVRAVVRSGVSRGAGVPSDFHDFHDFHTKKATSLAVDG